MSKKIWVIVEHVRGEVTDITYTMLAAGRSLTNELGGELTALLLGFEARDLADMLGVADRVQYVEHAELSDFNPDAHLQTIVPLIREGAPNIVLIGHTTMGMDIACGAALQLSTPLVSSCRNLMVKDGAASYACLTCGGKLVAEGPVPEPMCLITMIPGGYKPDEGKVEGKPPVEDVPAPIPFDRLRTRVKGYIEPEVGDVDIATQSILVSIGRGIQQQDNLSAAEELASALGGAVCSSRPVVDQGWLSTSRMVGKSGKTVKPKLYLALGISGAPEHSEGMSDAELIIAVNTDEKAPIYDVAHFGAAVDLLDLMPVLTEKVKRVKGG